MQEWVKLLFIFFMMVSGNMSKNQIGNKDGDRMKETSKMSL